VEDAMKDDMHEDVSVMISTTMVLTEAGNVKYKAVKDNKKCIDFYAIASKQMKLLCILTEAKMAWLGVKFWKSKKSLVAKLP
jgi:hypothetical protein